MTEPIQKIKLHPMIQKMEDSVINLLPLDDKSHINEYIYDLELPDDADGVSVIKGYAAESIGRMALKYDSNFIIICGSIPHLKNNLHSKHNHVIASVARACTCIAHTGGAIELKNNGFDELLKNIIKTDSIPFYVRTECARAYGWIISMVEIEKEQEVKKLLH